MSKKIISCSITGSIHTPSMSPYLPFTIEDIVQEALDAGVASVHIHARDPKNGKPSSDLEFFQEIITKIRAKNKEVIICVTTGGSFSMALEERGNVIPFLKPELASMNTGSINWGLFPIANKIKEFKYDWEKPMLESTKDVIFKNTFEDMEYMLKLMKENGTTPELECYDVGHLYNVKFLQEQGLIAEKPFLQFVLGINGALHANSSTLLYMKETADKLFGVGMYDWSAFGAGRMEFPICVQNLFLGGHVRVGLEDNLYLSKGVLAKNNGELVEKMVRLMKELDFEIASPTDAREILNLKGAV